MKEEQYVTMHRNRGRSKCENLGEVDGVWGEDKDYQEEIKAALRGERRAWGTTEEKLGRSGGEKR